MEWEHSQSEFMKTGIDENKNPAVEEGGQQQVDNTTDFSQSYNHSRQQYQWTDRQVTLLERQLLLNNYQGSVAGSTLSNWTKVFLCTISVLIPGIGQLIGLISGLVMIADDRDPDKRSYGAALITASIIVFVIQFIFWFLFALITGPELLW